MIAQVGDRYNVITTSGNVPSGGASIVDGYGLTDDFHSTHWIESRIQRLPAHSSCPRQACDGVEERCGRYVVV